MSPPPGGVRRDSRCGLGGEAAGVLPSHGREGYSGAESDEAVTLCDSVLSLPRDGGKRQAEDVCEDESQLKRSRRLPEVSDEVHPDAHVGHWQDLARKSGFESEGASHGRGTLHESPKGGQSDGEEGLLSDGRSRRERCEEDSELVQDHDKEEAGVEDMGDGEEQNNHEDPEIEEVDREDADREVVREDEEEQENMAEAKEESLEPPREEEDVGSEDREEVDPADVPAVSVAVSVIQSQRPGVVEAQMHVPSAAQLQASQAVAHQSLVLDPQCEEKKENFPVEQKLVDLSNGIPKLDIDAASKQLHIHHLHHQGAPKPPPLAWGAPGGSGHSTPSFASMLASTNTFAAMLQTGLAPPANQQPISIKLAGTNAFSAVLAAGTFSAVLAQGQDGKEKCRLIAGGDREETSIDKSGADKGEDGMEGDHKTDEEGKLKSDEDHDVDDHQQVLQAQGHVSEAHASEGHPAHEHMDAHIEQQGEPPQIDADGHIEAHGEVIGEGQVEAPCEGPGDGSSEVEGQDDGHHDGPGAGPDDYRVLASHAEAQQGEGEEAVRHDVENEGGEAGQEAPDYADGPEVGQNEVEAPGDHSSANHMDPGADESTEHKHGVEDEGGEPAPGASDEEVAEVEEVEAGVDAASHAEADHEDDDVEPPASTMEAGGDEGGNAEEDGVDEGMGEAYPPPGSENGDGIGMTGDGMGIYVGVGT